jgi:acyl-ACP thioesterase
MNNTRYPDMYSNFLPLDKKRIRSITISYMNEAPSGERLTVQRAYSDGSFYFRTLRQDGKINTEAEIQLADI